MTDFEKEEFWMALGQLYDAARETHAATEALRIVVAAQEERLEAVVEWLAVEERKRQTSR
jgi:hypothetical protein